MFGTGVNKTEVYNMCVCCDMVIVLLYYTVLLLLGVQYVCRVHIYVVFLQRPVLMRKYLSFLASSFQAMAVSSLHKISIYA